MILVLIVSGKDLLDLDPIEDPVTHLLGGPCS
jgi:hypothetical protein